MEWISTNIAGEMRGAANAYMQNPDLFQIIPFAKSESDFKAIRERACAMGLTEGDEAKILRSTDAVAIDTTDSLSFPRYGLWASVCGAFALKELLNGIVIDIERQCLFNKPGVLLQSMHRRSIPHLFHLISIPHSANGQGQAWMTTLGMTRFGLPEFQFDDITPDIRRQASLILGGVCQRIAGDAMRIATDAMKRAGQSARQPLTLEIPPALDLALADVELYTGQTAEELGMSGDGLSVGLSLAQGRGGATFVTLAEPADYDGGRSAWLRDLVALFPGNPTSTIGY